VKKYTNAEEATDGNMAHEQFRLSTKDYKHTLSEYVTLIACPLQQLSHERTFEELMDLS
jgi:hypothetical protein